MTVGEQNLSNLESKRTTRVASCTSCSDITGQIRELKAEIQKLRRDQDEFNFRLNQNFNALSSALGLGALKGATLAATIAAIASTVSAILNVVNIWANGAYLSRILEKSNNAEYAATQTSIKLDEQRELLQRIDTNANDASYAATQTSIKISENFGFLQGFAQTTTQNLNVVRQDILTALSTINRIPDIIGSAVNVSMPMDAISSQISQISNQISGLGQNISQSTTSTIRESIRELERGVAQSIDLSGIQSGIKRIEDLIKNLGFDFGRIFSPINQKLDSVSKSVSDAVTSINTTFTGNALSSQLAGTEQRLTELLTPLQLIPASVAGLKNQVQDLPSTNAFRTGVSAGVCNSSCIRGLGSGQQTLNNNLNNLGNALNAANAAANTAQLGLLNTINTKLGPQTAGGISGAVGNLSTKVGTLFSKTWNFFQMDRVINILTLVSSLITARQVSVDLAQLFFEVTGTVIQAMQSIIPGFLRDPDGNPLDLDMEEFFTQKIELLLISLLGEDNYKASRITWIKLNRILTSAANVLDASRSAAQAIGNGVEITAGLVGRFSNAAIREGLISEDAMPWSAERYEFNQYGAIGRYLDQAENIEEALDTVQQLAQIPITFVQSYTEATEATTELVQAVEGSEIEKAEEQRIDKLLTDNGLGLSETDLLNDSD